MVDTDNLTGWAIKCKVKEVTLDVENGDLASLVILFSQKHAWVSQNACFCGDSSIGKVCLSVPTLNVPHCPANEVCYFSAIVSITVLSPLATLPLV